jgi:hypothetical protein
MKFSDVSKSPQFAQLSEQQRTFISELCSNGWDKVAAAKVAWGHKDDESAVSQANRAMRNPRVAALLALIDPTKSRMTKDEALQLAAKHARTAEKPADAIKCLQLIGEWEGWSVEPPPGGSPSDDARTIYDMADEIERKSRK